MRNYLHPKVVDSVLKSNVAFSHFVRKAKRWTGKEMEFTVKISPNPNGGSFAGFQTFSTAAADNTVQAKFDPSFNRMTSSLPFDELLTNATSGGEEAVISLIKKTLTSDQEDFADLLGTQFWSDGTGNGGLDILGLAAAVDDGTGVATYGGLNRGTYTTWRGVVTSMPTLSLLKMDTLWYNVSFGNQTPSVAFCDKGTFSLYKSLLVAYERYMVTSGDIKNGSTRGVGALNLMFNGMKVLPDDKATSGSLLFINENYLDWYAQDVKKAAAIGVPVEASQFTPDVIEGNDYDGPVVKGMGFGWTNWIEAQNAMAYTSHTVLAGQLINKQSRYCGKGVGIVGV